MGSSNCLQPGAEFAVIDYKYSADFNYYKTRIDDILFQALHYQVVQDSPLPYVNAGIMENEGWELYLNFNRFVGKGFSMDFKINFANNRNTIIEIDPTILKAGMPSLIIQRNLFNTYSRA